MATCLGCGVSSRTDPGALTLSEVLVTNPLTGQCLSGSMLKTGARLMVRLACRCGWSILGEVRDGAFFGDPATQVQPDVEGADRG